MSSLAEQSKAPAILPASSMPGGMAFFFWFPPGKLELNLIQEDPDDNKFVQAALEGQAQYIVSGDLHLQKLRSYRDIRIVSPKEFVAKILSSSSGFRGC